jgi:hypothetical protein
MWAQLITMRLKPGKDMAEADKQLKAAEQPGSGLVRALTMHDQKDPSRVYRLGSSRARTKHARASRIRAARKGCKPPGP